MNKKLIFNIFFILTTLYSFSFEGTKVICSQATSENITIEIISDKKIDNALIYRSNPYYETVFVKKDSGGKFTDSPTFIPKNFKDSLYYRSNPKRLYTEFQLAGETKTNKFIDKKKFINPGEVKYKIEIHFQNEEDTTTLFSSGYRQISNRELLDELIVTVSRSQFKMFNIQANGITPAMKETGIKGDKGGYLNYSGYINVVENTYGSNIEYFNYKDFDIMVSNKQIARVNIKGSSPGGMFKGQKYTGVTGKNVIDGIYKGVISYKIDIANRVPCSGYYIISQPHTKEEKIPWDIIKNDVENYIRVYTSNLHNHNKKIVYNRNVWSEAHLEKN